jgi:hypothetical protein
MAQRLHFLEASPTGSKTFATDVPDHDPRNVPMV